MLKPSLYSNILYPLFTEKSTRVSQFNQYVFVVSQRANKDTVKKSIASLYNVKVKSVNIANGKAKRKRFKGVEGKTTSKKKAYVTLQQGYTIDLGVN